MKNKLLIALSLTLMSNSVYAKDTKLEYYIDTLRSKQHLFDRNIGCIGDYVAKIRGSKKEYHITAVGGAAALIGLGLMSDGKYNEHYYNYFSSSTYTTVRSEYNGGQVLAGLGLLAVAGETVVNMGKDAARDTAQRYLKMIDEARRTQPTDQLPKMYDKTVGYLKLKDRLSIEEFGLIVLDLNASRAFCKNDPETMGKVVSSIRSFLKTKMD